MIIIGGELIGPAFRALFHTPLPGPASADFLPGRQLSLVAALSPQLIEPRARPRGKVTASARDFAQSRSSASSHRRWQVDHVLQQHAQPVRARVPFEQLSFSSVG